MMPNQLDTSASAAPTTPGARLCSGGAAIVAGDPVKPLRDRRAVVGLGFKQWPIVHGRHGKLRTVEAGVTVMESSLLAPLAKVPVSLLEGCVIPGFEFPAIICSKITFFQKSDESAAVDLLMDSERARMLPIDQQSAAERVANINATQIRCVIPHVAVRAWPIG